MISGLILREAVHIYVEEYSIEIGLLPKTVKSKKNGLNRFLSFLEDQPLDVLAVRKYILYLKEKGLTHSSIRQEVKYIKALLKFLKEREYIEEDFSLRIKTPKVHREHKDFISEEKAEEVIFKGTETTLFDNKRVQMNRKEVRECLRFILRHGLRISEALKIRGKDLNLDSEQPFVMIHSKGGNIEPLPLAKDSIDILRQKIDREYVFPVSEEACNFALKKGSLVLGYPTITNHSLRHIFSLSRLRRREPLQVVSRALRHSSIKITDEYYSQFVLQDIAPTINNSPIIQNGLTTGELFEKIKNSVEQSGVTADKRLKFKFTENGTSLNINIEVV